jgi:hypothetical protein
MYKQYSVQAIHYVWYIWFPMPRAFFEYSLKGLWSLFDLLGFCVCNVKKLVLFSSQEFVYNVQFEMLKFQGKKPSLLWKLKDEGLTM